MGQLGTPKWARTTGVELARLKAAVSVQYASGAGIQQIADVQGRSYGVIRRILIESGIPLRRRGNPRGRPDWQPLQLESRSAS